MKYFGLWSLLTIFIGLVLELAYFTGTSAIMGAFFLGVGLFLGGIYLARRVSQRLRSLDPDPKNRDRPWPGAREFP